MHAHPSTRMKPQHQRAVLNSNRHHSLDDSLFSMDLHKLTVTQLKALCKAKKIQGYSKLNKQALIAKLEQAHSGSSGGSSFAQHTPTPLDHTKDGIPTLSTSRANQNEDAQDSSPTRNPGTATKLLTQAAPFKEDAAVPRLYPHVLLAAHPHLQAASGNPGVTLNEESELGLCFSILNTASRLQAITTPSSVITTTCLSLGKNIDAYLCQATEKRKNIDHEPRDTAQMKKVRSDVPKATHRPKEMQTLETTSRASETRPPQSLNQVSMSGSLESFAFSRRVDDAFDPVIDLATIFDQQSKRHSFAPLLPKKASVDPDQLLSPPSDLPVSGKIEQGIAIDSHRQSSPLVALSPDLVFGKPDDDLLKISLRAVSMPPKISQRKRVQRLSLILSLLDEQTIASLSCISRLYRYSGMFNLGPSDPGILFFPFQRTSLQVISFAENSVAKHWTRSSANILLM